MDAAPPTPAELPLPMLGKEMALPDRVRLLSEVVVPIAPLIEIAAAPAEMVKLCVAAAVPLRVPVIMTLFALLLIVGEAVTWTFPGKVNG